MSRWGNSFHYGNLSDLGSAWWGLSGSLLGWSAWWQPYDWQWRCGWFWHFRPEISGTPQDDLLFGSWWSDRIRAGAGDDIVIGWSGDDKVFGGTGNDLIFGNSGNDRLFGQEGNDWIFGGNGRDRILGGRGDDHLFGGRGNDLIWGNGGSDEIDGGSGFDTFRLKGATNEYGVFSDGAGGLEILHFETGDLDRVVNVERIRFDDETLNTSRIQTWQAGDGAGVFRGRKNGTDIVSLSIDPDLLPSTDIEIAATTNGIEIRSGSKITPLTFINIEDLFVSLGDKDRDVNLTISGDFEGILSPNTTHIRGTNGDNRIDLSMCTNQSYIVRGLGGDDQIFGNANDSTLFGDAGDDVIYAGTYRALGNNFVSGGSGDDVIHANGGKVSAFGGAGDDKIFMYHDTSRHSLLSGGTGNDLIGRRFTQAEIDYRTDYPVPRKITAFGNEGADVFEMITQGPVYRNGYIIADFNIEEDAIAMPYLRSFDGKSVSIGGGGGGLTRVEYFRSTKTKFVVTLDGYYNDTVAVRETRQIDGKSVEVITLNRKPVAENDIYGTSEDKILDLAKTVLSNDSDADKQDKNLLISWAAGENAGSSTAGVSQRGAKVTFSDSGGLVYDPTSADTLQGLKLGQSLTDSFQYRIQDGRGGAAEAWVTINIAGQDDAPVAGKDVASAEFTGLLQADAANGLLSNDRDPDAGDTEKLFISSVNGNALQTKNGQTFVVVTLSGRGELTVFSDGSYVFDPLSSYYDLPQGGSMMETISYEVSDGSLTGTGQFELTISRPLNRAPVIDQTSSQMQLDLMEDTNATMGDLAGSFPILSFFDPDPAGAVSYSLTFKSTNHFSGQQVGKIKDLGGHGHANSSGYSAAQSFGGVIANSDVQYLGAGEKLAEIYTFTVADGLGALSSVDLTYTISGLNDTPTANDDTATVFADQDVSVNLVQNDSDPDRNDTLTVDRLFVPGNQNARVILSGDRKSVLYDPDGSFDYLGAGETATDTLSYKVTDGGNSDESDQYADLKITVRGVNDGPNAVDDVLQNSVSQNGKLVFDFPGQVLANDTDPDQNQTPDFTWISAIDGASFSSSFYGLPITLASGAILTVDQNGRATFDTNGAFKSFAKGQTGTTSFTYTINDGFATDTATVEIKVTGENDAPDAIDDRYFLKADTPFLGSVFAANGAGPDIDPDQGDTFTVTAINGGLSPVGQSFQLQSGATLTLGANGTFSYDPTASLRLEALDDTDAPVYDSFTYQITDSSGAIDSALVVIETSGVNDAPIAQDDQGTTDRNTVLNVNAANGLLINDGDPDTADLGKLFITSVEGRGLIAPAGQTPSTTFTLVTGSKITVFADGSYSFDPNGVYNGLPKGSSTKEVVNYTVSDGDATDTARLEITVTVPPDQPPQFDFNTSVLRARADRRRECQSVGGTERCSFDTGLRCGWWSEHRR